MLLVVLITIFVAVVAAGGKVFFPKPSGIYHVGETQHMFKHTTHDHSLAPKGSNNTGEFIVVNVLHRTNRPPTAETSSKYMDFELARLIEQGWGIPNGELQKLWTHLQLQPPVLPGPTGRTQIPNNLILSRSWYALLV
ncbi:hypothetical protein BU16DRAFT_564309 [Lophium mytilinum]|uniref:Uncharacterized protein n=1 Tax=Lophium mytilinum TaxID=390894 RepID=A0A6A6QLS3_9PEZI|nr:hypothetical protein BU16DRAFT_564309 [Lophium mytilinum]